MDREGKEGIRKKERGGRGEGETRGGEGGKGWEGKFRGAEGTGRERGREKGEGKFRGTRPPNVFPRTAPG